MKNNKIEKDKILRKLQDLEIEMDEKNDLYDDEYEKHNKLEVK